MNISFNNEIITEIKRCELLKIKDSRYYLRITCNMNSNVYSVFKFDKQYDVSINSNNYILIARDRVGLIYNGKDFEKMLWIVIEEV